MRREGHLRREPTISILMTVEDCDEVWLRRTAESLRLQAHEAWELCAVDNASARRHVGATLRRQALADERVRVRRSDVTLDRGAALDQALGLATGELCAVMDAGDELAPDALFRIAELRRELAADVVYTDEDLIDELGIRSHPRLKTSWSPELLLARHYTGRLCALRTGLARAAGGFTSPTQSVEHDLVLRATEMAERVEYLPGILYHRRTLPDRRPGGTGPGTADDVVARALARRGQEGSAHPGYAGHRRVVRRVGGRPAVTAIVNAPDPAQGRAFAGRLAESTAYPLAQVLLAVPGPEPAADDVVAHPLPARASNLAAAQATSEFLLFMDASARADRSTGQGWLSALLGCAQQADSGLVGCRLTYSSGRLRQGGALVDLDALAARQSQRLRPAAHRSRASLAPFNPPVVRSGCTLVRREIFQAVGGFDEADVPRTLHDIDLSFRLAALGVRHVQDPHPAFRLGFSADTPHPAEVAHIWDRWPRELELALYNQSPEARLGMAAIHLDLQREAGAKALAS